MALFVDDQGQRFPYYTLRRMLHAVADRSGMAVNVTPRALPRSCTTELLRGGAGRYHPASPFGLRRTSEKELLGHESLDTIPSTGGSACG